MRIIYLELLVLAAFSAAERGRSRFLLLYGIDKIRKPLVEVRFVMRFDKVRNPLHLVRVYKTALNTCKVGIFRRTEIQITAAEQLFRTAYIEDTARVVKGVNLKAYSCRKVGLD